MTTRREVEWLIEGLGDELREALVRLDKGGAAPGVTALYRRWFEADVKRLRRELESRQRFSSCGSKIARCGAN